MKRHKGTVKISAALFAALTVTEAAAQIGERALVDAFEIDTTEVTIAQFREFAEAMELETEAETEGGGFEWGAGWERREGWNVYRPYGEDPSSLEEPAVHVSWREAAAYCRWRGGRLPTFQEWQRAAYTQTQDAPDNTYETGRTYRYPVGDAADGMNTREADPWPRHAPVASTEPGINGLYDMGGNVWEWLADQRGEEALTAGGSWWYGTAQTTADAVQWKPADFFAVYVGIRCAYDPR